jgi:hypothetical protein
VGHKPADEAPAVRFRTIHRPLRATVRFYRDRLEHSTGFVRRDQPFWHLVERFLVGAWTSYEAASLLMSENRKVRYPVQAAILSRNTLEAFGNFLCLLEQPDRWRLFSIDHYKHHRLELERERKRHRFTKDPTWERDETKRLLAHAHALNLTDYEASNPATLPDWPKPGHMVDSKKGDTDPKDASRLRPYLTDGRKTVFFELKRAWYGPQSRYAHHLGDAVAETSPSNYRMEYLRGHVVFPAALCLASMCLEIQAHAGTGWPHPMPDSLRTLWDVLRRMGESGDQLYRKRYRRILAA